MSYFLPTLGLDRRLQTGLSKQHTWDFTTVKSGCFKHPLKIYLHLKKLGGGRICQGKDHPAACHVLQLYFPNQLLQATIWEQATDQVDLWGDPREPSIYFSLMFEEPEEINSKIHSTRACNSNTDVFSTLTAEYFSITVKVIADYAHNMQQTISFDTLWGRIKEKDFSLLSQPAQLSWFSVSFCSQEEIGWLKRMTLSWCL